MTAACAGREEHRAGCPSGCPSAPRSEQVSPTPGRIPDEGKVGGFLAKFK